MASLNMVERQHFDVAEVAKYFGIKVSTVYHLAQQGKLPGFKVGGQWRFNKHILESWVANQVTGVRQDLGRKKVRP